MLKDLARDFVDVGGVRLMVRSGGVGPVLVLLHGVLQNGICWNRVAGELSRHFKVVIVDLRGFGESDVPADPGDWRAYGGRIMARDVLRVLDRMAVARASILGHDIGAQVAFRMALDHPDRLQRIGVIESMPNGDLWSMTGALAGMRAFHRTLLAQPAPLPERLIGAEPDGFVDAMLTAGTLARSLFVFEPAALASYRQQVRDPRRLAAMCAVQRAGIGTDRARDLADHAAGRRLKVPVHLFGADLPGLDARAAWSGWSRQLTVTRAAAGHFVAEEDPDLVLEAFLPFFLQDHRTGSPRVAA